MLKKEKINYLIIEDEFTDLNYNEMEKTVNSLIIKNDKNFILDLRLCTDITSSVIQNLTVLSNRAKKNLAVFVILVKQDSEVDHRLKNFEVSRNIPYFHSLEEANTFVISRKGSGLKYFTMEMAFSGDFNNLENIREFIWSVLHNLYIGEDEGNMIVLSIDEAVANIIEHAYLGDKERHLIVQAQYQEPRLRFVIIDNGEQFDPTDKKGIENVNDYIQQGNTGGLGIYIIEQVMDSFQHIFIPGMGNRLIMEKEFKSNENSNNR